MKRVLKIMIATCLLCVAAVAFGPKGQALAADYQTIELSEDDVSADAYTAIQAALDTARDNATEKTPYEVIVPEGTYILSGGLNIYSNTWLYAPGVTFLKPAELSNNMIRVGDGSSTSGDNDTHEGYYYSNITVEGATFDAQQGHNTVMKVAHATGVTLKDCTFENTVDAHLMEIAGIEDFTIDGCTFENQVISGASESRYEAIQIDILETYHYPGYLQEGLQNRNLVFKDSTFYNVPRGIGSHTAILNNPVDGVTITGCTFDEIGSAAIQGMNWINVTISGNTITDAPRGIAIYSLRTEGVYLASTLAAEGGTKTLISDSYAPLESDQNIVISGNSISTGGSDPYAYYVKSAISLSGLSLAAATEGGSISSGTGDSVPAGDYYLSGVTVSNNEIYTDGHGIRLLYTNDATIDGNTINYTGSSSTNTYFGINVRDYCAGAVITGNTVKDTASHGIIVNGSSKAAKIARNTVESAGGSGIIVESSSTVESLISNIIKNSAVNGIHVYNKATVKTVSDNEIISPGKYGIDVESGTVTAIETNEINDSANTGIFVYSFGTVNTIADNIVTSAGRYGIDVESSTVGTIKYNEVKYAGIDGIYVFKSSAVKKIWVNAIEECGGCGIAVESLESAMKIKGNEITKCEGKALIYLSPDTTSYKIKVKDNTLTGAASSPYKKTHGIYAKNCKVAVSGNKIVKTKRAICFTKSVKGTLGKNKYKNNRAVNKCFI
ncbi:MAG: right-handed parallel beta-helix repeat-containing protein [Clostridiales bacterium]|nr:right-handed parallel beta-helix repeat-containing protein [Clostridiales bacterium]